VILILENFFSEELTSHFIDFYKKNSDKSFFYEGNNSWPLLIRDPKTWMPTLSDSVIFSQINKIYGIVNQFEECQISNIQIVKWPPGSFMDFHKDLEDDKFAGIVYLNDDFEGGITRFENIDIRPKRGTAIIFKNSKLLHSVSKVLSNNRFTLSCWFN
jgi:hypothetical protein